MKPLPKGITYNENDLAAVLAQRSYYRFLQEFWHVIIKDEPKYNWHIKFLCDEFQELADRVFLKVRSDDPDAKPERLPLKHNMVINIPPGETKSTISTVMFPVWCWLNDPTLVFITASYSADLAIAHAMLSRDIIRSDKFQAWYGHKLQIRPDQDAKKEYGITYKTQDPSTGDDVWMPGGVRFSTSVGGTVTGKHAHIILIDDPVDPQRAGSDKERVTSNKWMDETMSSRKKDEFITPTILIQQRLHEQDNTGHITKKWQKQNLLHWISLPADNKYKIRPERLADNYTPMRDVDGNTIRVMNAIRRPPEILSRKRIDLGALGYARQYGQSPTAAEGTKLKKKWFKKIALADLQQMFDAANQDLVWHSTIDTAYTDKEDNDASGYLLYTQFNGKLYLKGYDMMWLEFPDLCRRLPASMVNKGFDLKRSAARVEPKASGKSLVQTLAKRGHINVIEDDPPTASKIQRVDNCSPFVEAGNVFLVLGEDWDEFLHQCAAFPNTQDKELVDCLCMAIDQVEVNAAWDEFNSLYE